MIANARLLVLAGLGLGLGACSFDAFTYTVDRYGTVKARQIHLGCRDTYEVFDRPSAGTLLVTTNGVNELLASLCGTPTEALPREARMRRVAQIFLDEARDRRDCRITRATPLSEWHLEYAYACGTAPPPESRRVRAPSSDTELDTLRSTLNKRRS